MQKKSGVMICLLMGHQWVFHQYKDWIKENEGAFRFTKARRCARCAKEEYFNKRWKSEKTIAVLYD